MKVKSCPVSIKAAGEQDGTEDGVFEAIVAAYNVDSVGDKILPGAFADTLAEWKASGDPIPVLWSHMSHDPEYHIGEVLDAEERPEGLWVKARLDLDDDAPKARRIYKLLKGRRVTQFSFAYEVEDGGWGKADGQEVFELRKLKLFEVGPCLVGANQATELLTVKSADGRDVRIAIHNAARDDADVLRTAVEKAFTGPDGTTGALLGVLQKLSGDLDDLKWMVAARDRDDEKATPAPPAAPETPDGATGAEARPGPASLRLRTDLAALEAEVFTLTD